MSMREHIAIVRYNAGNIFSVDYALKRLGIQAEITGDHNRLRNADKVIFPGVGEAGTTMAYLREHGLDQVIGSLTQPVLGICVGLQLMCRHSEESDVDCMGIFDEQVLRFQNPAGEKFKIPHMGWNTLHGASGPLFSGIAKDAYVYFVHSYYATTGAHTCATTTYIRPFSAALCRDNFHALQFHPEKSGAVGARILQNFLDIKP